MQRRRIAWVYYSVISQRVMSYLIVNLVHSMQYVLIEYVVRYYAISNTLPLLFVARLVAYSGLSEFNRWKNAAAWKKEMGTVRLKHT